MAIRKKLYSTAIKMCIALMIDKPDVKRQCAVTILLIVGKTITSLWEHRYQPLGNKVFYFNSFLRIVAITALPYFFPTFYFPHNPY